MVPSGKSTSAIVSFLKKRPGRETGKRAALLLLLMLPSIAHWRIGADQLCCVFLPTSVSGEALVYLILKIASEAYAELS